jgi:hypothetical protein
MRNRQDLFLFLHATETGSKRTILALFSEPCYGASGTEHVQSTLAQPPLAGPAVVRNRAPS